MRFLIVIIAVITSTNFCFAQQSKNWEELGDKAFGNGDYYGASVYYNKARLKVERIDLVKKLGEAYRLSNNYSKAEACYQYLVLKQANNSTEALFRLAEMQKFNGKYTSSIHNWKAYLENTKEDSTHFLYKKAKQELKSCKYALAHDNQLKQVEVGNLGNTINTTSAELNAWQKNDSVLIFSSLRGVVNNNLEVDSENYLMKLYLAQLKNNSWIVKGALGSKINTPNYNTGNGCFSEDGKEFYFTRCDLNYNCNIFKTTLENNQWAVAKPVQEINGQGSNNTQPAIVKINGMQVLLFSSNRKEGYGGFDVWYAIKNSDSTFFDPINFGEQINTPGNDITPFYDSYDSTLYFSSDWHKGFGGFDVFKAKLDWKSLPQVRNLKKPINTSVNDTYFKVFGNRAYLTSNRKGGYAQKGETCCNDLYSIDLFEREYDLIGQKQHALTTGNELDTLNSLLPLSLYFDNDYPDPRSKQDTTTHAYDSLLVNYKVKKELFIRKLSKNLRGNQKELARNQLTVFFDEYLESSLSDLTDLFSALEKLLNNGKSLELSVRGYASPLADSRYNETLTSRRIVSFYNMLIAYKNGVFVPFLSGKNKMNAKLSIETIPFGEYMALENISDNINDVNSIYSLDASLERKIDIVAITELNKENSEPQLAFDSWVADVGNMELNQTVEVSFSFTNIGNASLVIKNVSSNNENIIPLIDKHVFQKGERGRIKVLFTAVNTIGRQFETLSVVTNAASSFKKVAIVGNVNK